MAASSIDFRILQFKLTAQGIVILYWLLGIIGILLLLLSIKNLLKVSSIIGVKGADMPRAVSLLLISVIIVFIYIIFSLGSIEASLVMLKVNALLDLSIFFLYLSTRGLKDAIEGLTPEE